MVDAVSTFIIGYYGLLNLKTPNNTIYWVRLLTGHYQKREPVNISSLAADRQTQLERDVWKELGVDDQVLKYAKSQMRSQEIDGRSLFMY